MTRGKLEKMVSADATGPVHREYRRMLDREELDAVLVAPLLCLLLAAGVLGCDTKAGEPPASAGGDLVPEVNRLTDGERAEGWVLLFDGKSFDGWRGLGREGIPEGHWKIEDGTIRKVASGEVPTAPDGQPLEGGDLMTLETYENFELRFDWKVSPGANSGVKYNVSEEMSTSAEPIQAALGFEYQVLDDERHPDAQNGPNRTAGALYDLVAPSGAPPNPLRPVGEFNEARIVFDGDRGEHWLNGALVAEFDLASEVFAERLAASKYAPIEGFATKRSGHIVLQDHGDDVWFRNVKILRK